MTTVIITNTGREVVEGNGMGSCCRLYEQMYANRTAAGRIKCPAIVIIIVIQ